MQPQLKHHDLTHHPHQQAQLAIIDPKSYAKHTATTSIPQAPQHPTPPHPARFTSQNTAPVVAAKISRLMSILHQACPTTPYRTSLRPHLPLRRSLLAPPATISLQRHQQFLPESLRRSASQNLRLRAKHRARRRMTAAAKTYGEDNPHPLGLRPQLYAVRRRRYLKAARLLMRTRRAYHRSQRRVIREGE
jgi:hypothetical protein